MLQAVVSQIAPAIASQVRDGVFAELRRAGQLKPEKVAPTPPTPVSTPVEASAAPVAPAMTAADYQQARARDRAFDRAVASAGLTDTQRDTLESLYLSVNPPDPQAWASDLIAKMGLGKSATTAPPAPEQARPSPPPPAQNFSDKGPAASSTSRDPLAVLKHRATEGTRADFDRLVADHGYEKATQIWNDNTRAFLKTVRVRPGR